MRKSHFFIDHIGWLGYCLLSNNIVRESNLVFIASSIGQEEKRRAKNVCGLQKIKFTVCQGQSTIATY